MLEDIKLIHVLVDLLLAAAEPCPRPAHLDQRAEQVDQVAQVLAYRVVEIFLVACIVEELRMRGDRGRQRALDDLRPAQRVAEMRLGFVGLNMRVFEAARRQEPRVDAGGELVEALSDGFEVVQVARGDLFDVGEVDVVVEIFFFLVIVVFVRICAFFRF